MNQSSKTAWVLIGTVVVVGLVWYAVNQQQQKQASEPTQEKKVSENVSPLKLGFVAPLTGDAATLGQDAKSGVELAVQEINAAGGVNGRTLEVVYEDGKCTGEAASNAANKLISADKVAAIVGGLCSSETASFAGAAEQAKVPVMSPCSSAPSISQAGDYIFRDYPSDAYQGSYAAGYTYNTLGKKKAAVIYVKSEWGEGIKKVFVESFKNLGGEVVLEEGFDATHRDFKAQLTKVKAAAPDLLYFVGYTEASIPALKQAKQLGATVQLFGGDAWDDPKIWTEVGSAGEGALYTVAAAAKADEFKEKVKSAFGKEDVTICAPFAYDATKLFAQVFAKVGDNGEAVKNELYQTTYAGGVSSDTIKFDQNGDLVGATYQVKAVKAGKAALLK